MGKGIMSVNEVASYLGFSTKKIYRLAEGHQIPAIRVGRQYRFVRKVIDEWLKEMSISSLGDSRTKNVLNGVKRKG